MIRSSNSMTINLRTLRSLALAFGLALALSPLAFGQNSTPSTTPTDATRARSVSSGQKLKIKGVVVKRDADTFTVRDLTVNGTVVRLTDRTSLKPKGADLSMRRPYAQKKFQYSINE